MMIGMIVRPPCNLSLEYLQKSPGPAKTMVRGFAILTILKAQSFPSGSSGNHFDSHGPRHVT